MSLSLLLLVILLLAVMGYALGPKAMDNLAWNWAMFSSANFAILLWGAVLSEMILAKEQKGLRSNMPSQIAALGAAACWTIVGLMQHELATWIAFGFMTMLELHHILATVGVMRLAEIDDAEERRN